MEIKDKVALVTGGAHRVGKAIALRLARAGANMIITYHTSAAPAQDTVAELQTLGRKAVALPCDIADYQQVQALVAQIQERFGVLDILVNNADRWEATPFPTEDIEPWLRVTSTTIHGSYYVCNSCAPLMLTQNRGAIINIVDISVLEAWPNFTAHAVSKSALLAMTRQFALELAPTIRVNAIAPGPVLPPPDFSPEKVAHSARKTLLNRWGRPEDVAHAAQFLVEADYITGDTIFVDGGQRYGHRKNEHG